MRDFDTPLEAYNFARQVGASGGPRGPGGCFHVAYNDGYNDGLKSLKMREEIQRQQQSQFSPIRDQRLGSSNPFGKKY
jgi:hypothetical protein